MVKPWDADANKPGGETSMDVLIRWLLIPGKYQSWQSGNKTPLTHEILDELRKQGTSKRSSSAIRGKILKLKWQYENASNWLKTQGKLEEYRTGGQVDDTVEQSVRHQCPLYRELMSVFQTSVDTEVKSGEDKQENDTNVPNLSVEEELNSANQPAKLGERKQSLPVQEVAAVDSSVGKQEALTIGDEMIKKVVTSEFLQITDGNEALDEFRMGSDHRWSQYRGVNYTPYLGDIGDSMTRQLFNRDVEHKDALVKLRFEAELKRQEVRSNCEKTLLRHKLRSAGVPEEKVKSIIPE